MTKETDSEVRHIPADLRRRLDVESGHSCAIPTCRESVTEYAHITPWSEVKEHKFENMICLCPTCHTRYDDPNEKKLDRKSMLMYKARLAVLNDRYNSTEKRLLENLAQLDRVTEADTLTGEYSDDVDNLVRDGLLEIIDKHIFIGTRDVDTGESLAVALGEINYRLTSAGVLLINNMKSGHDVG